MRAYVIFEVTILGLIHTAAADAFKLKKRRGLEKCDHRWQSLGDNIEGKSCDLSGTAVSLSNDGKRVAIGAKVDEKGKGSVRVYKWAKCEWKQLGKTVTEKYDNGALGGAVSISGDGNTVAVGVSSANNSKGSVIVYFYSKKKKWVKCGTIDGEKNFNSIGGKNSVSMSDNGKTLAVGGNNVDVKVVVVKVDKNEKECSLKEKAVLSISKKAGGGSVNLSGNGKVVAVGTSSGAGLVEFFRLSGKKWDICYTFDGLTTLTGFGKDVSLSVDGARVVIGGNDSKNKGVVVLLQAVGNLKKCDYEIINLFQGEHEEDYSGGSVSISDDGQSIAIGAMLNDDGGEQAGHVRMHTYEGGTWYSEDVDGLDSSRLGTSVSMSGNGETVAIGAPGRVCGNDEESIGYVKVMKFGECEDELKIHRDAVKCTTEAPTRSPTSSPTTKKSKKSRRLGSVKTPKTQRLV